MKDERDMADGTLTRETILSLLNGRLNRVLLIAQAALPEHQFEAFRRLVLDEFGRAGLLKDLDALLAQDRRERNGAGWQT